MKLRHFCLALCLLPLAAAAQMYRWVDDKGQVHYTQTPPPDRDAESVKPAPPPSANPGMDAVRNLNQASDKARAEQAKKDAEAALKKAGREDLCQRARERVAFMESRPAYRVAAKNEDGSVRRMTPEEHDKTLADARKVAAENCQ
jgi:hypothetical protein